MTKKAEGGKRSGGPTENKGAGRSGRGEGDESRPVSPSSRAGAPAPRTDIPSSSTVAVVGAGRLGTALARALARRGYEVRALVSRSAAHARSAAARAGVETLALGAGQSARLPPVGLLFITTPDGLIAETAARLAALGGLRAGVALHASGALGSEVLAPLRERGLGVGSMHPLAAVSDAEAGAESLRRAFYCVEGDARGVRAARRVVRDLGGRSFTIDPGSKALYHAAAVMAAGHVVALFDVAADTLRRCGLAGPRARAVLLPLLRSTVENLSRQAPERALTGSFARMDFETMLRHVGALLGLDDLRALEVYSLLGRHSLGLALRAAGRNPDDADEIWRSILAPGTPAAVDSSDGPPESGPGGRGDGPAG